MGKYHLLMWIWNEEIKCNCTDSATENLVVFKANAQNNELVLFILETSFKTDNYCSHFSFFLKISAFEITFQLQTKEKVPLIKEENFCCTGCSVKNFDI